jgi:Txe/YoeB family toxin of Txe-Axe toxin-antitoxin module
MEIKSRIFFANSKIQKSFLDLEKGKYEEKELHKQITRALCDLKKNAYIGIQIPKNLIPKEYLQKYNITNLWKYNLPNAWRLIYSVGKDDIEIISIVLEWLDHKEYERRFNY